MLASLPEHLGRPTTDPDELVTSIIRQWLTYDGRATIFPDEERQLYADLKPSPITNTKVAVTSVETATWLSWLTRDWKIGPDELSEVLDQLNRAQRAEVVNADGMALRIWVNPKDRARGVEPVNWEDVDALGPPAYFRMAANVLEGHLAAEGLQREQVERLAPGVAKQWQEFDGHGVVFVDERRALVLKLNRSEQGPFRIEHRWLRYDFIRLLGARGILPGNVAEMLGRINRGEDTEFRDQNGAHCRLRHNPKARQSWVEALDGGPIPAPPAGPPVVCPKCSAVLPPWTGGQRQQTCRFCKHDIGLG